MIKFYKYLYYRLYTWNLKKWGESDFPQGNALLGVSFMMYINLGLLAVVLQFFGIQIFFLEEVPKKEIIILGLILLAINYFIFLYKGKYKKIVKMFDNETEKQKSRNILFLWIYVFLSFIIPSILLYIYKNICL